jgi:hypothetical protein
MAEITKSQRREELRVNREQVDQETMPRNKEIQSLILGLFMDIYCFRESAYKKRRPLT